MGVTATVFKPAGTMVEAKLQFIMCVMKGPTLGTHNISRTVGVGAGGMWNQTS